MKPKLWYSILVAVVLLLATCTVAPSKEASPTAIPVPTVLPTPSSIVPLEERLLADINVKFPDEMVFVQDFIWVKTDDGHVVQIDPATNSVVGDIKVDTTSAGHHYCQGIGTDGENIWVCSASGDDDHRTIDVVRVDPNSRNVVATVKVGKIFDQFNMPFLRNHIWVLSGDGSKLVGIDVKTNQPTPAIDLGVRCFQVAATSSDLLVTCKLDNLILRVDPQSMQVTEQRTISPSPWNIRATQDGVWVSLGNPVIRLDPQSLDPVAIFAGLPGDKDLFVTNDAVWVRLGDGFLYRIDPLSNQLVEQVISDQRFYNMGGFLVTDDSIWTSAGDDDLVLHISLK